MSSGYYRLGANVSGKVVPLKPPPPAIIDTLTAAERQVVLPPPAHDMKSLARAQGYTGNTCSSCGGAHMQIAGHCEVCADCGTTTGCS